MSCKPDRPLCLNHKKLPNSGHCLVRTCENYYNVCPDHQLAVGGRK